MDLKKIFSLQDPLNLLKDKITDLFEGQKSPICLFHLPDTDNSQGWDRPELLGSVQYTWGT